MVPRCLATGLAVTGPASVNPKCLTLTVVFSSHSTFYVYPQSHHLIRTACSHSSMRSLRLDCRQEPKAHKMIGAFAVLTQPDMFHYIDNVGGDNNSCGNMILMRFHLQNTDFKDDELPISYSRIHPVSEWAGASQKLFLRNNLKYLHDPRVYFAYSITGEGKSFQHRVMRSDFDGTWSDCILNIRAGRWTMPFGGTIIDKNNIETFLVENNALEASNKLRQSDLEFEYHGLRDKIEPWNKVVEFEQRLNEKEIEAAALLLSQNQSQEST